MTNCQKFLKLWVSQNLVVSQNQVLSRENQVSRMKFLHDPDLENARRQPWWDSLSNDVLSSGLEFGDLDVEIMSEYDSPGYKKIGD